MVVARYHQRARRGGVLGLAPRSALLGGGALCAHMRMGSLAAINARDGPRSGSAWGLRSPSTLVGGGALCAMRMGSLPVRYLLHVKHCRRSAQTRPPHRSSARDRERGLLRHGPCDRPLSTGDIDIRRANHQRARWGHPTLGLGMGTRVHHPPSWAGGGLCAHLRMGSPPVRYLSHLKRCWRSARERSRPGEPALLDGSHDAGASLCRRGVVRELRCDALAARAILCTGVLRGFTPFGSRCL
jgi:hypothetical protein